VISCEDEALLFPQQ